MNRISDTEHLSVVDEKDFLVKRKSPRKNRIIFHAGINPNPPESEDIHELMSNPQKLKEVTSSTVVAVKSLLADTKDERTRRGKYIKYTAELRYSYDFHEKNAKINSTSALDGGWKIRFN